MLVGDAFSSSCPAAGTGARKVLVDVERLCNVHIPRWLATPGMGEAKIAAFYDDPVKQACDALSVNKAFRLRSYSIDPALPWAVLRWVKFVAHWGRGTLAAFDARAGILDLRGSRMSAGRDADMGAQNPGAQIARFGIIISESLNRIIGP